MKQLESIERLIYNFRRLPGVGQKTAQRYAYRVIEMDAESVMELSESILAVAENVRQCTICGSYSENDVCDICKNRDKTIICVVSYPKDILSIDRVGSYHGTYHVLGGVINPIGGKSPADLRISELLERLEEVREVILATNPDVEGEATAAYLSKLIKARGIKVTRLAQGISLGSDIEYADEYTLSKALNSRIEL